MTQQPGQEWPQQNPTDPGAGQPPAYPHQPPAYPQAPPAYPQAPPAYPQQGYPQQGYPQAPAYQAPQYGAPVGYGAVPALPPLAHWGKRVGAFLLDLLLGSALLIPGGIYALTTAEVVGYDIRGNAVTNPTSAGTVALVVGYAWLLGFQIWNRWVRQGRTGRSVGKQVLKITLVSERTMAPIGAGMAFTRDLCHVVDSFLYLGYLWPLWDAKRQTFSDKIIGTVVLDG